MKVIISEEDFVKVIVDLEVGQGFDFSDLSRYEGGLVKEEYLEDYHRVELINFHDSTTLLIGGYGGSTISTDMNLYGNVEEENECNVSDIVEAFFKLYPLERIVVELGVAFPLLAK